MRTRGDERDAAAGTPPTPVPPEAVAPWLDRTKPLDGPSAYELAAASGRTDVVRWLRSVGAPCDAAACAAAARVGDLDMLRLLRARQGPLGEPCPWDSTACAEAAARGDVRTLAWLRHGDGDAGWSPCPWGPQVVAAAAAGGHVDAILWLRGHRSADSPSPGSSSSSSGAAGRRDRRARHDGASGPTRRPPAEHAPTSKWAAWDPPRTIDPSTQCPWDHTACTAAAAAGHLGPLAALVAYGAPRSSAACIEAARAGHARVLEWMLMRDWPWDPRATREAAAAGHARCVCLALETGHRQDDDLADVALSAGHKGLAAWLVGARGFESRRLIIPPAAVAEALAPRDEDVRRPPHDEVREDAQDDDRCDPSPADGNGHPAAPLERVSGRALSRSWADYDSDEEVDRGLVADILGPDGALDADEKRDAAFGHRDPSNGTATRAPAGRTASPHSGNPIAATNDDVALRRSRGRGPAAPAARLRSPPREGRWRRVADDDNDARPPSQTTPKRRRHRGGRGRSRAGRPKPDGDADARSGTIPQGPRATTAATVRPSVSFAAAVATGARPPPAAAGGNRGPTPRSSIQYPPPSDRRR